MTNTELVIKHRQLTEAYHEAYAQGDYKQCEVIAYEVRQLMKKLN